MSESGYRVSAYGAMIADEIRMQAYASALERAVEPGATVLDIGCGTGIFTLLACKCGARHVYAVEPSNAIALARTMARANGFEDRTTFYQDVSTNITLPERVDVIVSDLRGMLPLLQHHIPAIADAKARHLLPDGVLIPRCDVLWAVVAQATDVYEKIVNPWESDQYGVDMRAGRELVTNVIHSGRPERDAWLTEAEVWAELDYASVRNPDVRAEVDFQVTRAGTAHGMALWFDSVLFEDVTITTAPDHPKLIYGNAFFPWTEPVDVEIGDAVKVALRADLIGDEYVWDWNTQVRGKQGVKAAFKQSTFYGKPMAMAALRARAASYVPELNREGEIQRFALSLMDGDTPLAEIAGRLRERYPADFPDIKRALAHVGRLSAKFG